MIIFKQSLKIKMILSKVDLNNIISHLNIFNFIQHNITWLIF